MAHFTFMINEQLLKYIRSQRDAGASDQAIRDNLESAGWRSEDVTEGFQALDDGSNQSAKSGNNSPQTHKKIRRDAADRRAQTQEGSGSDQATTKQPADTTSEQQQNSQDQYREPVSDDTSSSSPDSTTATSDVSTNSEGQQSSAQASEQKGSNQINKPSGIENSPNIKQQAGSEASSGVSDPKAQTQLSQAGQSDSQPSTQRSPSTSGDSADSGAKTSRKADSSPLSLRTMEEDSKRLGIDADKPKRQSAEPQKSKSRQTPNNRDNFAQNQPQVKRRSQPAQNQKSNSSQTANARRKFSADPKNPEAVRKKAQRARQQKSSRSRVASIALFALAFLLLAGGGAFAYFSYFQGSTSAEATAGEVMQALADAGTFEYRATIERASNNNGSPTSYVIEGAVDLREQTPQETYYTITQSTGSNPPVRAISSEVSMYPGLDGRKQQAVSSLLSNPSFLTIGEFQTQEQLARTNNNPGFPANRFRVSFQSSALVSAYAELHQVIFDNQLDSQLRSQLDSSVTGFSPDQGQIWLDPETNYPYQITMIGSNNQGQRSQATIQFKNHGQSLSETPPYEERSLQSSLAQFWGLNVATSTTGVTDTSTSTADTGQDQSATTSDNEASTRRIAERRDQLRINDILQLTVALRLYQRENGQFPTSLSELASGQSATLTTVPRDPNTDTLYPYAVSTDRVSYHLGTTLETTARTQTFNDANFNSSAQGFTNGFNGAGESCGATQALAATCYDVTGQVN